MDILHLNFRDIRGGAAISAYRLHKALRALDQNSMLVVSDKWGSDKSVTAYSPPDDGLNRLRRFLLVSLISRRTKFHKSYSLERYEMFSDILTVFNADDLIDSLPGHDLVNLHWIANFVDVRSFLPRISEHTPVVWRFSDLNPITGGCHYDNGCGKYQSGCGACPQLFSENLRDVSSGIWRAKHRAFQNTRRENFHIVTQSEWMKKILAANIMVKGFSISVIPNGLDLRVYRPVEKMIARDVLGLPREARIVLFVSEVTNNSRKGIHLLFEAVSALEDIPEIFLLSVGDGDPKNALQLPGKHYKFVQDDQFMALIYSAADVYVNPAQEDNLPNTVLEAMACGTPVIGFNVGGMPELVRDGQTGYIVREINGQALGVAIRSLLTNPQALVEFGRHSRDVAEREYNVDLQARRFLSLYQDLVLRSRKLTANA